jgi:hypothetical protein
MKADTTPVTHRRSHAARNGHRPVTGRTEALVLAFLTWTLRRLVRSLQSMLPESRALAAEQRERERQRERRRRIALATTGVAVVAVLTARALTRH